MTVREALWLGTRGGADVLGRKDLGSLEPGKCADFAVWNTEGLEFGGADDPVAALVLSGPHRAERVYVGGEAAVLHGQLARADEREIARSVQPRWHRAARAFHSKPEGGCTAFEARGRDRLVPVEHKRCLDARRLDKAQHDDDRHGGHDCGDRVRDHQRDVLDRDAVREPEHEADEQNLLVADRDRLRRAVSADGADLEQRRERHRDAPGGGRDGQICGHVTSFGTTGLGNGALRQPWRSRRSRSSP